MDDWTREKMLHEDSPWTALLPRSTGEMCNACKSGRMILASGVRDFLLEVARDRGTDFREATPSRLGWDGKADICDPVQPSPGEKIGL